MGYLRFTLEREDRDYICDIYYDYTPGTPDKRYSSNGDPGEPGDPAYVELESIMDSETGDYIMHTLTPAEYEKILTACYENGIPKE